MRAIRHLLGRRYLAVLLVAATLLLKLLVPAGYMIDTASGQLSVTLCPGSGPAMPMMDMPGMQGDMPDHGGSKDHGKAEMPCVFSGLSAAMLGSIDPVQLAALIVFLLALGLIATIPPPPARPAYLRPPLRGPPAYL